ncbi:MAG: LysM peptidoglycan-binding domain-containing protein [Nanoarchaeota archaeon]|nr:LysM peptidoglycan-binding domain-containing protein [Nanoarchaeota archaeon]
MKNTLNITAAFMLYAALAGSPAQADEKKQETRVHTVESGETLSGIAAKYNMDWRAIQTVNNLENPNLILEGQELTLPGTTPITEKIIQKTPESKGYNLEYLINKVSKEEGIPDQSLFQSLLYATVMTESGGEKEPEKATLHEPGYQKRYVDKHIREDGKGNNLYARVFRDLKKKDPSLDAKTFRKQLATSVGLGQIMYQVAIEHGYRGTFEGLMDPETNLRYTAKIIRAHSKQTGYRPKDVATVYNTGNIHGTPTRNHLHRFKEHRKNYQHKNYQQVRKN